VLSALKTGLIWVLCIPLIWILCTHAWREGPSPITRLENWTLDKRFQYRGEQGAPIKIVYVVVDSPSLAMMGQRPWDLSFFSDLVQAAFKIAKAQAIGFDFVFSAQSLLSSRLIDLEKAKMGAIYFGASAIEYQSQVVFGVRYTQMHLEYLRDGNLARWGSLPFIRDAQHYDPSTHPYPEVPHYPLIGPNWGKLGLLDGDEYWDNGAIPRWMPMFTEFKGGSESLAILTAMRDIDQLSPQNLQIEEQDYVLRKPTGEVVGRLATVSERTFYTLGLELLLAAYNLSHQYVRHTDQALEIFNPDKQLLFRIPLTQKQLTAINWFSSWDNPTHNTIISVKELFHYIEHYRSGFGRAYEEARSFFEQMEGSIVLVGPSDSSFDAFVPTPFDATPVPKVSMHGNLIKTIASGQYLNFTPPWLNVVLTLGLTYLIAFFMHLKWGYGQYGIKLFGLMILLGYLGLAFHLFKTYHYVLPIALPTLSVISTVLISLLIRLIYEEQDNRRIAHLFSNYVSPTVVQTMIKQKTDPKTGGEDREVTAFFSDIEQFSTFAEKLVPAELVKLMNEYFEAMTTILQQEGGTLDKYIGDAIVAMFGAPMKQADHALKACTAAVKIQKRQQELNLMWAKQGMRWPKHIHRMSTRIGLNTGMATIGNMGSHQRFNYTMMGDTVNLANRCECIGKMYGVSIIATEATIQPIVTEQHPFVIRRLDTVIVHGKSNPVTLYEIMGFAKELKAKAYECADLYEDALDAYQQRQWAQALALLEQSQPLEAHQQHNPSAVLHKRITQYQKKAPPKDWQGIFEESQMI